MRVILPCGVMWHVPGDSANRQNKTNNTGERHLSVSLFLITPRSNYWFFSSNYLSASSKTGSFSTTFSLVLFLLWYSLLCSSVNLLAFSSVLQYVCFCFSSCCTECNLSLCSYVLHQLLLSHPSSFSSDDYLTVVYSLRSKNKCRGFSSGGVS